MKTTVPVRTNGRVVIPSHLRDRMGIQTDDLLEVAIIRVVEGDTDD